MNRMNFFSECYHRSGRIMFSLKPPFLPFFANSSFIMNEIYNRIMLYYEGSIHSCITDNLSFPRMRIPCNDVHYYYAKNTSIVSYELPSTKIEVLNFAEEEYLNMIDNFSKFVETCKEKIFLKDENNIREFFFQV